MTRKRRAKLSLSDTFLYVVHSLHCSYFPILLPCSTFLSSLIPFLSKCSPTLLLFSFSSVFGSVFICHSFDVFDSHISGFSFFPLHFFPSRFIFWLMLLCARNPDSQSLLQVFRTLCNSLSFWAFEPSFFRLLGGFLPFFWMCNSVYRLCPVFLLLRLPSNTILQQHLQVMLCIACTPAAPNPCAFTCHHSPKIMHLQHFHLVFFFAGDNHACLQP